MDGLEERCLWQNLSPILIFDSSGSTTVSVHLSTIFLAQGNLWPFFFSRIFSLMKGYSSYRKAATFPTHFISRKCNEHLLRVKCYARHWESQEE